MAKWNLDPAHTAASFSARHMMVTTVRGDIKIKSGTLEFDPEHPEKSSVEVVLDANSLYTGVEDRDNHLRSADFLEVDKYPHITFKSTRVQVTGENEGKITGDLTIRGVTRPVTLNVEFLGLEEKDPFGGNTRVGFLGTTRINREDWGLVWNVALESGGVLVGKEIKIELDAQAIKEREPAGV